MKIKIKSGTRASGVSLLPGKTYAVPKDVSEADAKILLRMKRAVEVKAKPAAEKTPGGAGAGGDDQSGAGGDDQSGAGNA